MMILCACVNPLNVELRVANNGGGNMIKCGDMRDDVESLSSEGSHCLPAANQ